MTAGLYIHIPFCISKCTYCDFFSVPSEGVSDEYVDALAYEIRNKVSGDVTIQTVYIGGGTPSLLTENQLDRIVSAIYLGNVQKDVEFTIEVNPDDVSKEFLEMLSKTPVNRISCGIQSFSEKCLSYCKRRASPAQNQNALDCFKKYWKKELSLDFIAAVPFETNESLLAGLEKAVNSGANHISFYSLTIEDDTPLGKDFNSGVLEYDFERADEMWIKGRNFLENHGFAQYEVSNFCKPGFECRHNLLYWNHQNYFGCGSGAAQTIYLEDGRGERKQNTSSIKKYIESVNSSGVSEGESEEIDIETSVFEYFMMGLRKLSGVSGSHFESTFGKSLPADFVNKMKEWEKEGLASISEDNYALTKKGILFLNRFLTELF